jgi:hypothetical protein
MIGPLILLFFFAIGIDKVFLKKKFRRCVVLFALISAITVVEKSMLKYFYPKSFYQPIVFIQNTIGVMINLYMA